jgi:hypothetical protein
VRFTRAAQTANHLFLSNEGLSFCATGAEQSPSVNAKTIAIIRGDALVLRALNQRPIRSAAALAHYLV